MELYTQNQIVRFLLKSIALKKLSRIFFLPRIHTHNYLTFFENKLYSYLIYDGRSRFNLIFKIDPVSAARWDNLVTDNIPQPRVGEGKVEGSVLDVM